MLRVYADGGVIRVNPSPFGGTWAFVLVEDDAWIEREESGIMAPETGIDGYVTNNVSELYALCQAILAIPEGTAAHIYSDSQVSLRRVFQGAKLNNVPDWLCDLRCEADRHLASLASYRWTLLDGHPTKAHLEAGKGKRGGPVSRWNVWCDAACNQQAAAHLQKLQAVQS